MKLLHSTLITHRLISGLITLLFILIIYGPAAALTTPTEPTITATVNLEAIEWQVEPDNTYERLILVVVGPDETIFRLLFEADDLPYLGLNSLTPDGLADGFYKYELKLIPTLTSEVRELVALIRAEGDSSDLATEVRDSGILTTEGVVLAGCFTIDNGVFLLPDAIETAQSGDQVVLDDMIVDGSLCVGFDCVNGESFGFDTIRLKENNLRIHFQDTSSTASFPTNDWRIIINDSSNGGGNYFAIEDSNAGRQTFKIEAGAPSSSLYVEDSGQIGLGTANPVLELHIADGDTPAVRLDQDGTSGWPPQTWDVAGNEANFFIRDVTNGSRLPFRIRPGAPTSSIDIQATGEVQFVQSITVGSSRDIKQNIEDLTSEDAFKTLKNLAPVTYQYKADQDEKHVGFIAEDVPDMVAVNSRKGLSTIDIVAVLTKVLQEQQQIIDDQKKALQRLDNKVQNLMEDLSCYNF